MLALRGVTRRTAGTCGLRSGVSCQKKFKSQGLRGLTGAVESSEAKSRKLTSSDDGSIDMACPGCK